MRRRLCRRRDGAVSLVAMASLPSPMLRRLSVVNDDGDGTTGDHDDDKDNVNDDGATGDDDNDNRDGATDNKVDYDDGNCAMDDNIDGDCDGATTTTTTRRRR